MKATKDFRDLAVMSTLVFRVHMMFYILSKGYKVPGNQGTPDKLNQILWLEELWYISVCIWHISQFFFICRELKTSNPILIRFNGFFCQ